MKLSELETLEREAEAQGYRVAFTGPDGEDELTRDDGTGWPTWDDAKAVSERFRRVARLGPYSLIRVIGPDGDPLPTAEPMEAVMDVPPPHVDTGIRVTIVPREGSEGAGGVTVHSVGGAIPPAESELPVLEAIPAAPPVTVLTCDDENALVGDGEGQVYLCPVAALQGREGVRWRPKLTTVDTLILSAPEGRGSERIAHFQYVCSPDGGLSARVAYYRPSPGEPGLWRVKRAA